MASKRTPVTSMRLDPELKAEAQKVFGRVHISMTAAVNMYLSEVVRTQGIPLPLHEAHILDSDNEAEGRIDEKV